MKNIRGILLLTFAAFSFSLSTVFVKYATLHSAVSAREITFLRFILGFVIVSLFVIWKRKSLRPKRPVYVILRAISNTVAVLLFFLGIQYSTVTNANLLNMSYPLFVFVFAPFINKETIPKKYFIFLILGILGVIMIMAPDFKGLVPGDVFSLSSGVVAGVAIALLREARKYDESHIILFYLMGIGSLISFFFLFGGFTIPRGTALLSCLLAAFFAIAGQIAITIGFRYIDAAAGALVSTSRILFATILGVTFFSDILSPLIIVGGILMLVAVIGVSSVWKPTKIPMEVTH